jgi:exonuclease VII small subunit
VANEYVRVHRSDLEKIRHALDRGTLYFERLNEMNAALHLADPSYSPLTGTLKNARTRVDQLLDGVNVEEA